MLQFFKKPGQKYRSRLLQETQLKSRNLENCKNDTHNLDQSMSLGSLEETEEDNYICDEESTEICSFHSSLSKSLPEILADKSALGYFIQYMDSRNCVNLIKFWLEIECLCGACEDNEFLNNHHNEHLHSISSEINNSLSSTAESNDNNFYCNTTTTTTKRIGGDGDSCENLIVDTNIYNNTVTKLNAELPKNNHRIIDSNVELNYNFQNNCRYTASTVRQDAEKIYKKYIDKNLLDTNLFPDDLLMEMEEMIICENDEPLLTCLSLAQKIVYKILEDEYLNDFLKSEYHCKHQIDVLTSGNVQLEDILYNETAFFYFMEFMEVENKRNLLDFWMSVVNYKQNLVEKGSSADPCEAQTDAVIIYEKYFSLQATMPLGFTDKVRFQVEQNICREDGKGPQPDCFDLPCKLVYNFLKKNYLPAFLSSQLYYKYLSELINNLQSSSCTNQHRILKRAESDCGSEASSLSFQVQTSSQRTAEEQKRLKNTKSMNGSMSIDTKQLYDPDSLWKRKKRSLSVGYVDSMGRFITEIESHRKNERESRLSRAVKRLVNMEQDKAKEELAWKIAEMIIREITTLTLGASDLPS
ncbi:A-kinase anchor protein 10, mitochondrial [Leptopilina boulardi]|uniref:A-kinase anchor protein 10, mitochondrial n=1 Tax=Leptopilina boulardi TaxID=63433 RepID=UPI0021F5144E|nr:A-kinase anchor protein 10, mitochondrial [Leptopilina boulardi]